MADRTYSSADERNRDLRDAEAISRRDESKANILRSRAGVSPDGYQDAVQDASKASQESARRMTEIAESDAQVDKSGTAPTLSDSRGNFAPNPEVANTGGIGVEASNSTEGGDQAGDPDAVDLKPAEVGITDGDKVIGDTGGDDGEDDLSDMTVPELRQHAASRGIDLGDVTRKQDIIDRINAG